MTATFEIGTTIRTEGETGIDLASTVEAKGQGSVQPTNESPLLELVSLSLHSLHAYYVRDSF